ncbi:MAG: pyridoxamine 5'-phosphate oxidase family protein [Acholeplasmatales bacterium]|jgi:uncharacterized pyridoxamine 5'-phosphate oxidase family protein|nr:pyridoxamine 5'-phosphate oxidase family protein [Acholeplasmatales bacterium]
MNEIYEFLNRAGTYYLATIGLDGLPKVRPFGTINIYNKKLYIQTGAVKDVCKQLLINPSLEISACLENKWIRLSAEAVLDNDIEASIDMLQKYPSLKSIYKAGDGNSTVFYLKNVTAILYEFGKEKREIKF